MKLAIGHIEQQIQVKERELADAKYCAETCQKQLDDANDRITQASGMISDLRAALAVVKASQNVAAIPEQKRLEKRR